MRVIIIIFCFIGLLSFGDLYGQKKESHPEKLAQAQLDAYNARDIEAFLEPYTENVEVYNFPDQLIFKGKDKMRPVYAKMFEETPDLHCELVNRMVLGTTVIDQEKVTGFPGGNILEVMAVYKIDNGKIAQVYFIRK